VEVSDLRAAIDEVRPDALIVDANVAPSPGAAAVAVHPGWWFIEPLSVVHTDGGRT
jgi:hypothetical protein